MTKIKSVDKQRSVVSVASLWHRSKFKRCHVNLLKVKPKNRGGNGGKALWAIFIVIYDLLQYYQYSLTTITIEDKIMILKKFKWHRLNFERCHSDATDTIVFYNGNSFVFLPPAEHLYWGDNGALTSVLLIEPNKVIAKTNRC